MIFLELVLFYPLYCGNIADTKVVKDNAHNVNTWIKGTTAQLQNNTSRDNFKNNPSVFGTKEKYTKSGTD